MKNSTPHYWQKAKTHLSRNDKVMAGIIKTYKGEALRRVNDDVFHTLARAVVGQQISVKAADSIWARFSEISRINPQEVLRMNDEKLRSAGLSGQKVKYLKSISEFTLAHDGNWHDDDDEVIRELCRVKGVGKWTAEMFLIFYLQRPDVFPLADIGLLKACEKHYGVPRSKAHELGDMWRPYRSVATWYLWRSLDPIPVEY